MTKLTLKSIAENILNENTPVYEHDVLVNFQYKKDCNIVTIRQDIKNLKVVDLKGVERVLKANLI